MSEGVGAVGRYDDLSREDLEARTLAAERVAVLYGWTPVHEGSLREDALFQLWSDWRDIDPERVEPSEWPELDDEALRPLAEKRRRKREGVEDVMRHLSSIVDQTRQDEVGK